MHLIRKKLSFKETRLKIEKKKATAYEQTNKQKQWKATFLFDAAVVVVAAAAVVASSKC